MKSCLKTVNLSMRPIFLKTVILLILTGVAFNFRTYAQTCNGSLGDPVINQNFGAGTNPGTALPFGVTNMTFTQNNCPNDGFYTISNSLVDPGNCHPYTWYNVKTDHTGNPNGYMMIVNASYEPSIFFIQQANGLCPNTTYEFSAYVLNLCIPSLITASYTQPDITFSIETTSGQVLQSYSTGEIYPSPYNAGPTWIKYPIYFTTNNETSVVVKMTNNAPGGNGNDFIIDDITFRACGPIIESGFASVTGPRGQSLCEGSSANFVLKAQVIANTPPSYQWQSSTTTTPWTDVPGGTGPSLNISFTNAKPDVYQYRLGVSNGSAITDVGCRVYAPPLTVWVNPTPVVSPFPPQTVCEGHQLKLTATGGSTYIWTGPNMAPTNQNPLIINNVTTANAGTYQVVAMSDSGCVAPAVQAQVNVIPQVVAHVSYTSTAICTGQSTQLSASGGLYYKWTPSTGLDHDDIPNPTVSPSETTTYTVHVGNGGCTDSTQSVTVTVYQNPVADAGSKITLFEGQSAKLDGIVKGDNITGYSWSPATFLSDPTILTPVTTPTHDITYTLTATSQSCGTATSQVFVRVFEKIIIPSAFSPNNDGINDYWNIAKLTTYPDCSVLVYNRYGQQVFQSVGYGKAWDGTFNGAALPVGTYYYIIDLKNNIPKISGWVVIIR